MSSSISSDPGRSTVELWAEELSFRPESGSSLSDAVYFSVRDALKRGTLPTGTRLVEGELAKALDVSRTPIRESLRRLESDGLVRPSGGRGYIVADLMADAKHVFLIRARLEGLAAMLAAENITVAGLEGLQQTQDELRQLVDSEDHDPDQLAELNHRFHSGVADAAQNPRLRKIVEQLHPEYMGYQVIRAYDAEQLRRSVREHQAILDALWKRDGAAADDLVQKHFEHGRSVVLGKISRGDL